MKRHPNVFMLAACTLSAVLLSIPWLVPHTGALALVAFVPLLFADYACDAMGAKRFFPYHFYTFVLWNTLTTFWVCNATVGGGIFAILANSAQMSLVWALFRLSKRRLSGVVPYIFLAAMWIAWEARYFDVEISWPWLVLGNAFAASTRSIQWYEYTGTLGGSLWIWLTNLGIFGLLSSLASGRWYGWNRVARSCSFIAVVLVLAGPLVLSKRIYDRYVPVSEGKLDVLIAQPNLDPYEKFESLPQSAQTERLLSLYEKGLSASEDSSEVLLLAPETFTSDVVLNRVDSSATVRRFKRFLSSHPGKSMLFGASAVELYDGAQAPSLCARPYGDGWYVSRNCAMLIDSLPGAQTFYKSKLVVGVELTPYPRIFVPVDNFLSDLFGLYSLMGRCEGQDKPSVLYCGDVPIGTAICYESVYGEYCTGYVKAGAEAIAVITNDAWWGDTPGYRQHMSYSRLRAIELRRDIARCANTGISCFINQRGDVVSSTPWWEQAVLEGSLDLNSGQTFFVRNGDMVGRISTLVFLLLAVLLVVRFIVPRR